MLEKDWQAEIRLLRQRDRKARAILGVSEEAGRQEIRRAFRQAIVASHPDVNPPGAETVRQFHLLCHAYRCLADGEFCATLDECESPPQVPTDTKYRLDNPWGYLCWWRDKYFGRTG